MVSRETLSDGAECFSPSNYSRRFLFFSSESIEDAINYVEQQLKNTSSLPSKSLEVIDTTKDFNQNKWLGKELKNTLIFINNRTSVNAILSVAACVQGGCFLVIAYDKNDSYGYFKKNILFSELERISKNQKTVKQIFDKPKKSPVSSQTHLEQALKSIDEIKTKDNVNFSFQDNFQQNLDVLLHGKARIFHLIGERGVGKSTFLGLYLQTVLGESSKNTSKSGLTQVKSKRIIFSSPSRAASNNALSKIFSDVSRETFAFIPPSELENQLKFCDILIVDEAASLNNGLLKAVIAEKTIEKIIFSTTIDGYEGTGQSYRLSFLSDFDKNSQIINLNIPKRFSPKDEFHHFSKRLYAENSMEFLQNSPINSLKNRPKIGKIASQNDGTYLLSHETLREKSLTEPTFLLLRESHYRSTPNDLARFYDNPAIFAIKIKNGEVIGAANAISEALDKNIPINSIINGTRRPKNAMTQQAIIHAYGDSEIAKCKILRISRVAIDEAHRRKSYATQLINKLETHAFEQNYDFLSTSFSGNERSLRFWLSQGFIPVRIGLHKNKWNDEFAILMIKSVNKPLSSVKNSYFSENFSYKRDSDTLTQRLFGYFCQHFSYFYSYYAGESRAVSEILSDYINSQNVKNGDKLINTFEKQRVMFELDSVLDYHRNINWIMPMLHSLSPSLRGRGLDKLFELGFINNSEKTMAYNVFADFRKWLNEPS